MLLELANVALVQLATWACCATMATTEATERKIGLELNLLLSELSELLKPLQRQRREEKDVGSNIIFIV